MGNDMATIDTLQARLKSTERELGRQRIKNADLERKLAKAKAAGGGGGTTGIGVSLSHEMIGPVEAQRYLDMSRGNRSLRRQHIAWLAREMQQDRWRLTHQTVAISCSGRLLDGHHRLSAIVKAQVVVPLLVMAGLPDETWDAIDCGAVRTAADRLEFIEGAPAGVNRRAATLATQLTYDGRKQKPTNAELEAAFADHAAGIRLVLETWPRGAPPITSPTVLLPIIRGHTRDPQRMPAFIAALATARPGADVQRHGQLLRVHLLDRYARRQAGYRIDPDWQHTLTQHLVDAYLADQPAQIPAELAA